MSVAKEWCLRILVAVSFIWGAQVCRDLHKEVVARQIRKPEEYPRYSDFYQALSIFVGMLVAQLMFRTLFKYVALAMIPKKPRWSTAVYGAKITRCCDSVFKCVYYAAMTTWCFALLRDEPWFPRLLGGSGETRHCFTGGYPFQTVSPELRRFYLTAIGYHLSEVAMLLLEVRLPDFWEMMLHHTVAMFLVFLSYILNFVRIGSLVLFLHGGTDIFIYLSKALVDTPATRCSIMAYFALIIAYVWFRIIVFPVAIMRSAWIESVQEAGQDLFGWAFLNFSLCLLLLLHMYWFGLILKIGFVFRTTGQARDLQSNLSSIDMDKQK
eukprot:TRINITY_DN32770_c1_g1_i1.p1 TRINITY_DN32770_c1_g1~~TRINITY_DN32770_c1_g1_i1.p1  ORF type:complete len:324 (+),score=42.15 TRINITY_DN32770_c1_g1_i1:58-1029(+)